MLNVCEALISHYENYGYKFSKPFLNPKLSHFLNKHFKDNLFRYRKDRNYPIDNNLAERQVRPFTALSKGIQHYGSDGGAERAAVYLSVVSMYEFFNFVYL